MIARVPAVVAALTASVLSACGGTSLVSIGPADDAGASPAPSSGPDASPASPPPPEGDAGVVVGTGVDAAIDATLPVPGPTLDAGLDAAVDAGDLLGQLLGLTTTCTPASKGTYATDRSSSAAVPICRLNGGFFWQADMGIDCDGQRTSQCNATTDASWSGQTSFPQSNGQPLVASQLPFVVVPLPSGRFDYTKEDVQPGAAAIVIYGGKMAFGVFGDEGPAGILGDASYAMAQALGIDPSPKSGGTAGPVTYFVLTGKSAVVSPIEDHTAAVALGTTLALDLVKNN